MSVVIVSHVEKFYGNQGNITQALNDISFAVEKQEFTAVMGASGSGKTTLLNVISTIDAVSAGNIEINGNSICELRENELAEFRKKELGFIFQDFNLLDTLTAYENIALALSIQGVKPDEIDARIREVARELDIESVLKKYPYEMSGGQKQRVASARAIITEPKLILADEPTGALDSKTGVEVLKLLKKQCDRNNGSNTVIIVTHNALFADIADTIIRVKNGKIESVTPNSNPKKIDEVKW